jgi:hypothetical protein
MLVAVYPVRNLVKDPVRRLRALGETRLAAANARSLEVYTPTMVWSCVPASKIATQTSTVVILLGSSPERPRLGVLARVGRQEGETACQSARRDRS